MWWLVALLPPQQLAADTALGLSPDTTVAIMAIAGSLGLAALAWLRDRKSATAITARLDAVESRTERQDKIIVAQRDYINELINWGVWTKADVPRRVPEPPDLLRGGQS